MKMIANVTYGYAGATFSGRMPCVDIADAIVSKGRETLETAIRIVNSTTKWNAKVQEWWWVRFCSSYYALWNCIGEHKSQFDFSLGQARISVPTVFCLVRTVFCSSAISISCISLQVVYGDTDSMFVHLPGASKEEAFRIGQEIADHITKLNPPPVKLKFEKVCLVTVSMNH